MIDIGRDGYFFNTYKDRTTGQDVYFTATQFEEDDARMGFPCIDEPEFKATFDFKLGRNQSLVSLFNTPMKKTGDPVQGYPDFVWDEYETTVVMSTYLIAFAIGPFDNVVSNLTSNGVHFSVWARPDAIADDYARYASDIGPRILEHYESVFGIQYVLSKMDEISTHYGGSAMENWGLITYGENGLLLDFNQTSIMDRNDVVSTHCHEIAHQWFGNLVTTAWWDTIWLNEGFATYINYISYDFVEPDMTPWDRFTIREKVYLMKYDATPNSHPILQVVDNSAEADFGTITYDKGGSMNLMMHHMLTFDTFIKGLQYYLTDKAFQPVVTEDLMRHLTSAGHEDGTLPNQYNMSMLMDGWLTQKNYPLLTVTRNYDLGLATLTQDRFLISPDDSGDTHNYQWYLPISYSIVSREYSDFNHTHPETFLEPDSTIDVGIGLTDAPVIFNLKNTGYYRVDYDDENWNRIIAFLEFDDFSLIHVENRVQLLSDSLQLVYGKQMGYELPRRVHRYLTRETQYPPLSIAMSNFASLVPLSALDPDGLQLRDFLANEFISRYEEVGIDFDPADSKLDLFYKKELIETVCVIIGEPNCVLDAQNVFAEWMNVPEPNNWDLNPVNQNLRYEIYCTVVKNGGNTEYDFLVDRLDNCFIPHEQTAIQDALGCSENGDKIEELLQMILNGKSINPKGLLKSLNRNPVGKGKLMNFVHNFENELYRRYGKAFFSLMDELQFKY